MADGRALAPTHWHHAPDHDRYESRSSVSSNRHVACGAPDEVASSQRRRRPSTTRSRTAGVAVATYSMSAPLRRARRTAQRVVAFGRRSRTTGMAMRSGTSTLTAHGHPVRLRSLTAPSCHPPEAAVQPLGGADAPAAVPPRRQGDGDDPVHGGERQRRAEPGRLDPAEPVDDEVEDEGVGDVQRQAHRAGVAEHLDRRRSGEALGEPGDRPEGDQRRAEGAGRVRQAPAEGVGARQRRRPHARPGGRRHHRRQPEQRDAATDRRDPPPVGRQHAAEHDAGTEERQPRQQRMGPVDEDVEDQRPRRAWRRSEQPPRRSPVEGAFEPPPRDGRTGDRRRPRRRR